MFRLSIFESIGQIRPSPRGELEITDAISKLIELGGKVQFTRLTSWWLDTGKKDDLLIANHTVLDDWLKGAILGEVDADSQIVGRVRLEEGARVERSSVRGPVIIGKGAVITDSRIGPFTAVGEGVRITRSNVEHSVLMQGCSVVDVSRLEDSLIGKRVVVHPGGARQGALSLMVGDDCVVELAKARANPRKSHDPSDDPHPGCEAGARWSRQRRQDRGARPARRGLRGHLHRPAPNARHDRQRRGAGR